MPLCFGQVKISPGKKPLDITCPTGKLLKTLISTPVITAVLIAVTLLLTMSQKVFATLQTFEVAALRQYFVDIQAFGCPSKYGLLIL